MTKEKTDDVTLMVMLLAPVERVWAAWTRPQHMGWFGSDPAGVVIEAQADPRKGGRYRVTFANSDGSRYTCLGTYLTVEPLRRLEFTWTWAGREEHTECVRVALAETEGGTAMLFEHRDIDPATTHGYAEGWRTSFEKLERLIRTAGSRLP
jgi:uncharacterized protein YndB with AHSA1/START domain